MQGRSCLPNLIELFKEVTKKGDERRVVDMVCADYSKASDKVLHG